MNFYRKTFFALCGLSLIFPVLAETVSSVYVIPHPWIQTYVAVTPDTIDCKAWEKWMISDMQSAALMKLLKPGKSKTFDRLIVRGKIIGDQHIYYIDGKGGVFVTDLATPTAAAGSHETARQQHGEDALYIDWGDLIQFGKTLAASQRQDNRPHTVSEIRKECLDQ